LELLENRGQEFHIFRCLYIFLWTISSGCAKYFVRLKGVGHQMNIYCLLNSFSVCCIWLYGSRYIQLPLIEKLIQWLSGPSPSLSATTDRPTDTGPDSNDVRTRSIYSTNSVDDINAKAVEAWKLKRSVDMYTLILLTQYGIHIWHELAYTLLHFLKLNSNICGTSACFFLWLLTCIAIWTVLRHTSARIKYKRK
jgi:hypothetical protein